MKIGRQTRNMVLNGVFIVGTFAAVVYFALRSGDISQVAQALRSVDLLWLLGGVVCFLINVTLEGTTLHVFLVFQNIGSRLSSCLLIGLIGMYYSAITPSASGGQPVQIFLFKKRGIPIGITSSALAVKFFCWQCALLLLGGLAWINNPGLVSASTNQAVWLVRAGFFFNGITVVAVILLVISRNIVRAIIIFCVDLAFRLKLVKDRAATSSRWDAALLDFHDSVDFVTKHPGQLAALFFLALAQVTALMSAVYFVYRGFGLDRAPYADLLTVQLMLFIAVSFTPLPGASGAQEGGFYLFFSNFFNQNTIFAALFVWRFITYYLSIILGFGSLVIDGTRNLRKAGKPAMAVHRAEEPDGTGGHDGQQRNLRLRQAPHSFKVYRRAR